MKYDNFGDLMIAQASAFSIDWNLLRAFGEIIVRGIAVVQSGVNYQRTIEEVIVETVSVLKQDCIFFISWILKHSELPIK